MSNLKTLRYPGRPTTSYDETPLGTVLAWDKSINDKLFEAFVECNGQELDDAESPFDGKITLSEKSTLELQHQCRTTQSSNGFGHNVGEYFTVDHETYARVRVRKVG